MRSKIINVLRTIIIILLNAVITLCITMGVEYSNSNNSKQLDITNDVPYYIYYDNQVIQEFDDIENKLNYGQIKKDEHDYYIIKEDIINDDYLENIIINCANIRRL